MAIDEALQQPMAHASVGSNPSPIIADCWGVGREFNDTSKDCRTSCLGV
jgi:hypothetical protein